MSKTRLFFSDVSGSHYRTGIFTLLDKHYDIDWVFGEGSKSLAKIDDSLLSSVKRTQVKKVVSNWYWQKGIVPSISKKYDYYVLNGELYSLSVWAFLVLNRVFFRKRVYLWSHGWYGRESGLKKRIKSVFFALANGSFFYGNYAKTVMRECGQGVENIHVIHNSLNYDKQLELREQVERSSMLKDHFKNTHPNVIFIGRLTFSKKLDMLIKAAAVLKARGVDVNLTFVGSGEAQADLEQLASDRGVSAYFYGACYDELINAQLISSADVCVSPGNVGLTAIHCLMFGTPVITHNNFKNQGPEFEAIAEGKTGSYFKENDIESLVETMQAWINGPRSRVEIRNLCYREIDESWNPEFQLGVFSSVIPK